MKSCLLLAALVAWLPLIAAAAEASARPNVILILTDDQGYGDLGCHGNPIIRTPHLDRLHGQSVRLTNYHVDPTCSPSRAAMLTGRYSTRTGVWHTIMGRSLLHRDEVTMADVFRSGGYRTAMFGKWHLGDNYPFRPEDRGFDETLHHGGGGIGQTPDHWGNTYQDAVFLRNGQPVQSQGYCTEVFFAAAETFIAENRAKPFFVQLATNVPHAPFEVAEKYRAPYAAQGVPTPMDSFYGMIENMDEQLGRLLVRVEELGLAENTIVIWMTDNGTAAGVVEDDVRPGAVERSSWRGFNAGMRGKKGSEYDGGHRVPCFVRWPRGGIEGGRDVPFLTAHFDLLPTLIELCGLSRPAGVDLDGMSLASWLRNESRPAPERTLFVHRQRREIPPKWEKSAVLTERWRLVNGAELYDVATDPAQTADVAEQHAAVLEDLRGRYEQWWQSLAPAMARDARIVLGAPQENPTVLTAMDWHNEDVRKIPWHQRQADAMPAANGYWLVDVAQPGNYEFTLRHKPRAASFPLQAVRARVRVDEEDSAAAVSGVADAITLSLNLPAGPARLQTWLEEESPGATRGAFFVEVRRRE